MKKFRTILISCLMVMTAMHLAATEKPSIKTRVIGKGQPVIMIPGLTCDGSVWDGTIDAMGDGYQYHVMTLAGFAGNAPLENHEGKYLQKMEQEIVDYINDQKLDNPIIVGHSLGGFLALRIATDHPDLPSKLVIVDSLPFLPAIRDASLTEENAKASAEAYRTGMMSAGKLPVEQQRKNQKEFLKWMIADDNNIDIATQWYLDSDLETVAQAMYELNTIDMRQEIAKIKVPTLVLGAWIAGEPYGATREGTLSSYKAQYEQLPGVQVDMTDKGNHFIMWDDPEFFYDWLKKFL